MGTIFFDSCFGGWDVHLTDARTRLPREKGAQWRMDEVGMGKSTPHHPSQGLDGGDQEV